MISVGGSAKAGAGSAIASGVFGKIPTGQAARKGFHGFMFAFIAFAVGAINIDGVVHQMAAPGGAPRSAPFSRATGHFCFSQFAAKFIDAGLQAFI